MPALVDLPFEDTFMFSRGREADYTDAAGAPATAAIDAPRLDHSGPGVPRGLLVEGRPQTGFADRCIAQDGDWYAGLDRSTVLHEYETAAGQVRLRAWYADRAGPRQIVEACLNTKGWHRLIAVVPGHLPNRGGEVRWRDKFWSLGGLVVAEAATVLAVDIAGKILIEG